MLEHLNRQQGLNKQVPIRGYKVYQKSLQFCKVKAFFGFFNFCLHLHILPNATNYYEKVTLSVHCGGEAEMRTGAEPGKDGGSREICEILAA
jgi:hypothetical protein